jgi:hypothetical protein
MFDFLLFFIFIFILFVLFLFCSCSQIKDETTYNTLAGIRSHGAYTWLQNPEALKVTGSDSRETVCALVASMQYVLIQHKSVLSSD